MAHTPEHTAAMIVVGDEILSGKTTDTNSALVIRELRQLGVRFKGLFVIPDELDTIAHWIRELKGRYTYLFTSGGVGPTHDDVTVAGVALGLGTTLAHNAEFSRALETVYGQALTGPLLKMTELPVGAELLNEPGLRVPVVRVGEIYIFPGEPSIFRRKFLAVRHHFHSTPFHLVRIYTMADESEIASVMEEAQHRFGVKVGSYPLFDHPDYRVQITIESKDRESVESALGYITAGIPAGKLLRVETSDSQVPTGA